MFSSASGGGSGGCIPGEDVMMNHVILKHMFDQCGPGQLNNFRRVCKHWYKTSLPAWLRAGPAKKFKSEKELRSFLAQLSSETGRSSSGHDAEENDTDDKKGEIIASGIRQYRKFDLEFSPVPCQLLEAFWNKVGGAQLTHLTVGPVTFPPNNGTLLNNFLRFKYTPNLEYLEGKILIDGTSGGTTNSTGFVADGGDDDDVKVENFKLRTLKIDYHDDNESGFQPRRTTSFPFNWKEFLSQFPKLKFFEVGRYLSGEIGEVEGILKAIKEIRDKDKSKLELKSLIWSFNVNWKNKEMLESRPLPPAIYNLLRETGLLQVDSFRMDFSTAESEELIHGVMSLYAKSLRKLEIYRFSPFETSSSSSPFHDISQLQSLTVSGFPLKNLDLLKTLPNLASLCLWGDLNRECPSYTKDLISSTKLTNEEGVVWTFPSLAKFCCNYVVNWTANDISQLQTLMPALSHLELALTDVTFRRVCQYWPRLEHLSVYGNEVGDEGLVGFRQKANSHYVNYSKPNITSLTYLKSFAIETTGLNCSFPEDSPFTWHSVFNGFCELPNLKKLLIESDEVFECQAEVVATIPFAKVMIGGRRLR